MLKAYETTDATEWNSAMLKDAALMVLDIAEIGWKYGFNMVDCHKLNVMFKNNRPIYVDLGSFVPREEGCTGWKPYKGFLESYTYILDMWTQGCPQVAKRMMSPGVYLRTADYMAYKHRLYRSMPKVLDLKMRLMRLLNHLATSGKKKFVKSSVKNIAKKLSNIFRPSISQHLGRLRNAVKRLKVVYAKKKEEVIGFDHTFFALAETITCINIENNAVLSQLTRGGRKIISINENDSVSNLEYKYLKNITSVSYSLLNGGILIRDKYPETRLCSEVVIAKYFEGGHGLFGLHNSLVYLEHCMTYSKMGKMYVWMPKANKAMLELLKERFVVEEVSKEETLIKLSKKIIKKGKENG